MPTVQNRSRFFVTVPKHPELRREFPFTKTDAVTAYISDLKQQGFKPALGRADDAFELRFRDRGAPKLTITCTSLTEVQRTIDRINSERSSGLFIDYGKGLRTTFADLIRRYLTEEAPKHKSCEMEVYKLNGLLRDAGCEPVNIADILKKSTLKTPPPQRRSTGVQVRESANFVDWIHKPFAKMVPDDFEQYIMERLESVAPATVDRELDLFSAICRIAMRTWRIPIQQSPMEGVQRPRYFNERDRRLAAGEWERLIDAACVEDREKSIDRRLEILMADTRALASETDTVRAKKALVKDARATMLPEAQRSFKHVPVMESFVRFQVLTAARRSETLNLLWINIDLEAGTAFLPETKNGRPRTLPLRSELVDQLRRMPRSEARVFPISADYLRKAWVRMTAHAKLVDLHVHDLRHEAISQVAETGQFSVLDLQAFSGHRDLRMLARYTHLCASQLGDRLDQAFAGNHQHKGRRRFSPGTVSMAEVISAQPTAQVVNGAPQAFEAVAVPAQTAQLPGQPSVTFGSNVIRFPVRKIAP